MSDPRSEIRAAFQRRIDAAPMAPDLPWRAMEHAAGRAERRPLRLATFAAAGLALLVVVTLVAVAVSRQQHGRPTVPAAPVTTSPSPTTAPSPTASPAPEATPTPASSNPTFTTYRLPDANQDVASMTAGPDGAVWFAVGGSPARIGRIAADGTVREFTVPGGNVDTIGAVTAGPDGAVWFTDTSQVGRIASDGRITRYPLPQPRSDPQGITAGPDGALWFTEMATNKIGRITTAGAITEFPLPANPGLGAQCGQRCPLGIVAGPDGALWFTESQFAIGGGNKIGRITVDGKVTEYPVPTDGSPYEIVLGSDGNLWFSDGRGGKVGRVTPQGRITEFPVPGKDRNMTSGQLTAGPDGAVWFVLTVTYPGAAGPVEVARIVPSGEVRTYSPPAVPQSIVRGPDGSLWLGAHGQIMKVVLAG